MRLHRCLAGSFLLLAACGGGDKPVDIGRPASPAAKTADAPAAVPAGPCVQGPVRLVSKDVPYNVTDFQNFKGPVIEVGPNDYPNCKVASVRVLTAITAPDLSALGRLWKLNFNRYGAVGMMGTLIHEPGNLRGTQIGSSCGSLVFGQGGPEFVGREPPYDGLYNARGARTFEEAIGKPAAGKYTLVPTSVQGPLTITCFEIEMEFQQG